MSNNNTDVQNEKSKQKESSIYKIIKNISNWPLGRKIFLGLVGIIATYIIGDGAIYYKEKLFPNVYCSINVDSEKTYPCAHLLSDPVNKTIVTTLDYEIPVDLTLENDNKTPIYINEIALVIDKYEDIPRESYLLLKDYFTAGDEEMVKLGTLKEISPLHKEYPLYIIDKESGDRKKDVYLQLDAGFTDIYLIDLGFYDEGMYEFHFDIDYTIHGKKHTITTEKGRIINAHRSSEVMKNPDNNELKNKIITSVKDEDLDYSIYGDGTISVKNAEISDFTYEHNKYILKKLVIEEGVKSIDQYYTSIAGPNVTEIQLPSTLKYIADGAFSKNVLVISTLSMIMIICILLKLLFIMVPMMSG